MRSKQIKKALKLALGAVLLASAYRAGATSGDLVVARLASEVNRCPKPLSSWPESADLRVELARHALVGAVQEAESAQQTRDALRSDDVPLERLEALWNRLRAQQRRFRMLKEVRRERETGA